MKFNIQKVLELMGGQKMTQETLASKLNVSIITVRSKLNGKTEFKASEIIKLSDIFNVDPSVFFTHRLSNKETNNSTRANIN
jgi:transcriptional regulator with XRE-family HTH domain